MRAVKSLGLRKAEATVARRVAEAEGLKKAEQLEQARDAYEAALQEASNAWPPDSPRLGALRHDRDEVAKLAAAAQLSEAEKVSPLKAIEVYRALQVRARKDAALAALEDTIRERLSRVERLSAESDLAAARRAAEADRSEAALDLCERLSRTSDDLDPASRRKLAAGAEEVVSRIVARRGIIMESSRGQFTLGTSHSYDTEFRPLLDDVFARGGYVQPRPASPWDALWKAKAPYRVTVAVDERYEGTYLQSMNRLSLLSAQLTLSLNGEEIWKAGPLLAQSPSSLPKLSGYHAGRLGMSDTRSSTFERLLYDEARATLVEKLKSRLRQFPASRQVAPSTTP